MCWAQSSLLNEVDKHHMFPMRAMLSRENGMTNDPVLPDLQAMFQVQAARPDFRGGVSLIEDDVQRWIACSGTSRSALYDEIAV